jgi:CheY-like chemotaxis protein
VHGGLGLGLALVRHLVELHGGEVSAHSDGQGRGSRFTVRLPARRGDITPIVLPQPVRQVRDGGSDLKNVTALIVDDDRETRDLFAEILALQGARVLLAASGAEAFAIVQREAPDVMVMDIGMPNENGFSLLGRIRALESAKAVRPTPAVAVTAYAGAGARAEAQRAGFAAYVSKPAPPDDVVTAILQVLPSPPRT